ncbi:hypothetical protein [Desulfoplanes formicivorans]|uniref:Uncharacterized protein n=1 Tax=Desulfoplanes formicivorans TaxID=1592317 RepID=A0A194AG92_9BACT|nr:hypothetical protein [Desulfoplanes formicivorans]GAU09097.1 hypothetical protein DPF_1817 [Desulfoplanes formicivorans]
MDGRKKLRLIWSAYCCWGTAIMVFLYQLTIMALTSKWTMLHIWDLTDPTHLLWIRDISSPMLQHVVLKIFSMSLISFFGLMGVAMYSVIWLGEMVSGRQ